MQETWGTFEPEPGVELRYGGFPPKACPVGAVVVAVGRTEFVEKYLEVIDDLQTLGYQVWCLDWRGQGLSTRQLPNPHKGHIDSFDTYVRDLHEFITVVVGDAPRPRILLAHSMGSLLALQYLHKHPGFFDKSVLSAPMLAVKTRLPRLVLSMLARVGTLLGLGNRYVGAADYQEHSRRFGTNMVTRDRTRFDRTVGLVKRDPRLALGGFTFRWMWAALRAMRFIRRRKVAASIQTPTLVIAAGADRCVQTEVTRDFVRRMPNGRFVCIDDAEHEILADRDDIRRQFWAAFTNFVGN